MSRRAPVAKKELTVAALIRRKTIFSFSVFLLLIGGAWLGWRWLYHAPNAPGDSARQPLRKVLQANEKVFSEGVFSPAHKAKEYPLSAAAKKVRVNGNYGLKGTVDTAGWRLKVARQAGDTLYLTLQDLKALPKRDIVFDFKCIEGWSQVTHWGGVRVADFIDHYGLQAVKGLKYMGLITPDGGYYVGIDMQSALQEQTLLCYEMNGEPLPLNQGYPLRLIIPVKYGIKHLKRIGTMYFSNTPPRDYWAERGYDYYSGL